MALMFLAPSALAAEYKLSLGDVLEFSIAGAPEMRQKVSIGVEGSISLPLIGEVEAAGFSLAELRAEVRNLMSQKEYRRHAPGNVRSSSDFIWPDQISLNVVEYRPVYLNGDVAKPGEQKFKPGMTVRQALSLAGGYDILRFRMENPFLESADLRGEYESAWIDYAREQARLARLHAELGDDAPKASLGMDDPPLRADLLAKIRSAEASYRKTHQEDYRNQHSHLESLLAQYDANIDSLTKRRDTEMDGTQFDEVEYKRIDGLYKNGVLPMTRVAEARRVMLLSATQALQSQVELERAKTEREMTRRQTEALDGTRRMELLQAQQESQTKLAALHTRIQAIADKLLYAGALKTQLARGTGGTPDLALFRNGQRMHADEETELQPGDVVEVALKVEEATAASIPMH